MPTTPIYSAIAHARPAPVERAMACPSCGAETFRVGRNDEAHTELLAGATAAR